MKNKNDIKRFLKKYCNKPDKVILDNFVLSDINLHDLPNDFLLIEQCLQKILQNLLLKTDLTSLLQSFGVHKSVIPYAHDLLNTAHISLPMIRVDLIPDENDRAKICEINVGPSLGGIENFQLYRLNESKNRSIEYSDPYRYLSILIESELQKLNLKKIVIADFEDFIKTSTYNLDWLKLSLEYWIPGVDVKICSEKNILQNIDKNTLVFRIFMSADVIENMDFYRDINEKSGRIIYDFSCDFFASKKWFSLLWDKNYSNLFSHQEKEAITKWIPKTINVEKSNMEYFIENKDEYYFKAFISYGGKDVRSGSDFSKNELRKWINEIQHKGCVAQEVINNFKYNSNPYKTSEKNLVLGIYRINNNWSGCFVRMHSSKKVINISSGSYGGWGHVSI